MGGLGTGIWALDWAVLAGSLFNTILLLWLGLTVLLNAERRTWGTWVGGGALLLAAGFFFSHSAILGHGLDNADWAADLWWRAAWGPVIALPLAWYLVMLWYAGYWDDRQTRLYRRQRLLWPVPVALAAVLAGLLLFTSSLPSFAEVIRLRLTPASTPMVGGVPVFIPIYAVYGLLCVGLSLDALRDPGPVTRVMGDLGRRRARPWLAGTAGVLLLISLLAAVAMIWIVLYAAQRRVHAVTYQEMARTVGLFDLALVALIALAVILVGQAVVSYEIFTGKTLPRGGFRRHWRNAIFLAAGYGSLVAASLLRNWYPITVTLLATVLMTAFYALYHWRSYAERELYMDQLRPFVASQGLYADLLAGDPAVAPPVDAVTPFRALCADVLGAQVAYLAALGRLSPLAGPPLAYPTGAAPSLPGLGEIAAQCGSPQTMCVAVDPARYGGAQWAVPLWSARGLIGVLLLGAKRDGGLYTQEEIEIARASGERLIDTQASAEMAGRLMALQRQRLAETQVLDRRTRRVLHDEVLPRLHAAMLKLSATATEAPAAEGLALLADVHRQISDLLRELPPAPAPAVARLGLVGALQQLVEDELRDAFDSVTWDVPPAAVLAAEHIAPLSAEVLYYAARETIRNAARYGRAGDGSRPLHLRIGVLCRDGLEVVIEDDGVGLGAAPAPTGGSGQGLALHSTMLAVVGGSLATDSVPGRYTRVLLSLPQVA